MITNIQVLNFRSITELEVQCGRLNLINGDSGSGKSSFIDAIKFALLGNVSKTDIANGKDYAMVTIVFNDGTSISRKRMSEKTEVRVNDKVCTAKAANDFIEEKFNCSMAALESVCGIDLLSNMTNKDLTSFVLSILPIQVSIDKLIEFIKDMGTYMPEADDKIRNCFKNDKIITFERLEKVCTDLKSERTVIKRDLKNLEAKSVFDKKLPEISQEEIQNEIAKINLVKSRKDEQASLQAAYEKAVLNRRAASEKLVELKAQLTDMAHIVRPDETVLQKAMEEKQKFHDAVEQFSKIEATTQSNIDLNKKTLNSLNTSVCPISNRIFCSADKSGLRMEIESALEANTRSLSELASYIERCKQEIVNREAIISGYNESLRKYEQKQALQTQIDTFVVPDEPVKPAELSVDYSEEALQELTVMLQLYNEAETAKNYKAEYDKKYAEYDLLEYLICTLDVKGVQSYILNKSIEPLKDIINSKAKSLRRGFQISFDTSNGLEISVAPRDNVFVPMEKISTGEFLFAAYLIMCCVQQITGVPLLLIDNINDLDTEKIFSFYHELTLNKDFENIFVAGIDHQDIGVHTNANRIVLS